MKVIKTCTRNKFGQLRIFLLIISYVDDFNMFKKCKYTTVVYFHFLNMLKSINCKKKKMYIYTITAKRFLVFKKKITKKNGHTFKNMYTWENIAVQMPCTCICNISLPE